MALSPARHCTVPPVLAPVGELDIVAVPRLQAGLKAAHSPGAAVVVDLREVTFMDSSAIAVLLAADRRLRATGGQLRLLNASEGVLRVLRICGLAHWVVPGDGSSTHGWSGHVR